MYHHVDDGGVHQADLLLLRHGLSSNTLISEEESDDQVCQPEPGLDPLCQVTTDQSQLSINHHQPIITLHQVSSS